MIYLVCGVPVPPGSRTYLKAKGEEEKHIIAVLKRKYLFSKDDDQVKFFKKGVVCRGKWLCFINKLAKLKKEVVTVENEVMDSVENEVMDRFGDVIVRNELVGSVCDQQSSQPLTAGSGIVVFPVATSRSQCQLLCTPRRSRNAKSSVGVRIIILLFPQKLFSLFAFYRYWLFTMGCVVTHSCLL